MIHHTSALNIYCQPKDWYPNLSVHLPLSAPVRLLHTKLRRGLSVTGI